MQLIIKYFGLIQEVTNKDSEIIQVENHWRKSDILNQLVIQYPALENISFQLAVNQTIINDNVQLMEGSELALLPPFAGG
jgi:molybdopterin converting factor small subunit